MTHLFIIIIMYPTSITYEPRAPALYNGIANEDLSSSVTFVGTKWTAWTELIMVLYVSRPRHLSRTYKVDGLQALES